jgi:hypothetical protein
MDPAQYFKPGSSSYVQATQALEVINAAEQAGLKDEAAKLRSDLEASIIRAKQSGGTDFSGFDSQRKFILETIPKRIDSTIKYNESVANQQNENARLKAQADAISSTLNSAQDNYKRLGIQYDASSIDAAANLLKAGDISGAQKIADSISSTINRITEKRAETPAKAPNTSGEISTPEIDRKISMIDGYMSIKKDGNARPTERLKSITGVGEDFQSFIGRYGGDVIGIGNDSRQRSEQSRLIRDIVLPDVLQEVQKLKPASNTDVQSIYATRPSTTSTPQEWADYLSEQKKKLLELKNSRNQSSNEINGQTFGGSLPDPNAQIDVTQTRVDALRADTEAKRKAAEEAAKGTVDPNYGTTTTSRPTQ